MSRANGDTNSQPMHAFHDMHHLTRELSDPIFDRGRRGLGLPAGDLPGRGIQRVDGDLPPVH